MTISAFRESKRSMDTDLLSFSPTVCAAPGSKTFQLLEIIHEASEPGSLPNGLVCILIYILYFLNLVLGR